MLQSDLKSTQSRLEEQEGLQSKLYAEIEALKAAAVPSRLELERLRQAAPHLPDTRRDRVSVGALLLPQRPPPRALNRPFRVEPCAPMLGNS